MPPLNTPHRCASFWCAEPDCFLATNNPTVWRIKAERFRHLAFGACDCDANRDRLQDAMPLLRLDVVAEERVLVSHVKSAVGDDRV